MRKARLHPSGDVVHFKEIKKDTIFRIIKAGPEDMVDETQLHMTSTAAYKDDDGNWVVEVGDLIIKDH